MTIYHLYEVRSEKPNLCNCLRTKYRTVHLWYMCAFVWLTVPNHVSAPESGALRGWQPIKSHFLGSRIWVAFSPARLAQTPFQGHSKDPPGTPKGPSKGHTALDRHCWRVIAKYRLHRRQHNIPRSCYPVHKYGPNDCVPIEGQCS